MAYYGGGGGTGFSFRERVGENSRENPIEIRGSGQTPPKGVWARQEEEKKKLTNEGRGIMNSRLAQVGEKHKKRLSKKREERMRSVVQKEEGRFKKLRA